MKTLHLTSDLSVMYVGPEKNAGPLPTLFYFALSAEDSLTTDPYNQPVQFLQNTPLRIFSLTLPMHENRFPPKEAFGQWAKSFALGKDILSPFFDKAEKAIKLLIEQEWILPEKLALAGLSRGVFIACHVAARCKEAKTILGFAPLIRLSTTKEFISHPNKKMAQALDLDHLPPLLYDRRIRFYMGNNDRRVGTESCFTFIDNLAKRAAHHHIRSSPIELIIGPSFGFQGHGTPPERFQSGVDYLKGVLL